MDREMQELFQSLLTSVHNINKRLKKVEQTLMSTEMRVEMDYKEHRQEFRNNQQSYTTDMNSITKEINELDEKVLELQGAYNPVNYETAKARTDKEKK